MFEELAMFKSLSYSSEFVSIRQPLVLSTIVLERKLQGKNLRAGSPDIFMSMVILSKSKFRPVG